jgi:hypothetical protein
MTTTRRRSNGSSQKGPRPRADANLGQLSEEEGYRPTPKQIEFAAAYAAAVAEGRPRTDRALAPLIGSHYTTGSKWRRLLGFQEWLTRQVLRECDGGLARLKLRMLELALRGSVPHGLVCEVFRRGGCWPSAGHEERPGHARADRWLHGQRAGTAPAAHAAIARKRGRAAQAAAARVAARDRGRHRPVCDHSGAIEPVHAAERERWRAIMIALGAGGWTGPTTLGASEVGDRPRGSSRTLEPVG